MLFVDLFVSETYISVHRVENSINKSTTTIEPNRIARKRKKSQNNDDCLFCFCFCRCECVCWSGKTEWKLETANYCISSTRGPFFLHAKRNNGTHFICIYAMAMAINTVSLIVMFAENRCSGMCFESSRFIIYSVSFGGFLSTLFGATIQNRIVFWYHYSDDCSYCVFA